jgi:hypothetical protein
LTEVWEAPYQNFTVIITITPICIQSIDIGRHSLSQTLPSSYNKRTLTIKTPVPLPIPVDTVKKKRKQTVYTKEQKMLAVLVMSMPGYGPIGAQQLFDLPASRNHYKWLDKAAFAPSIGTIICDSRPGPDHKSRSLMELEVIADKTSLSDDELKMTWESFKSYTEFDNEV